MIPSAGLGKAGVVFEEMAGGDVALAMHGFAAMIPEAGHL